ncbi:MAG: GTP cyclohydrolase I, partial [Elusimicrobia bacterium]|nr:GTP cyclohydrolase I [Elusimicrobiota bacterium]
MNNISSPQKIESSLRSRSIPDVARELLSLIGEDPHRTGIKKTPERFAKAISELTSGYAQDIDAVVNGAVYPAQEHSGMVIVRDISFYSLCEHHLLPFHGRVSVGYMPQEKIIGLSKIPRIVQIFSRRLQLQERLTRQIAAAINDKLQPAGVGVLARARHM